MSEKIKQVAKAIREASDQSWEGRARAAIEAVREPTEDMLDSGACFEDPDRKYALEVDRGIRDEGDIAKDVWRAMVEAALIERPAPTEKEEG